MPQTLPSKNIVKRHCTQTDHNTQSCNDRATPHHRTKKCTGKAPNAHEKIAVDKGAHHKSHGNKQAKNVLQSGLFGAENNAS